MSENNEVKLLIIPIEESGNRFDVVLAQMLPEYSRTQLTEQIKLGNITLNQKIAKPKDKVIGGELVQIKSNLSHLYAITESIEPENIALEIAYEDEHLLVVNKPAGLVVHPGAGNPNSTLVNALLHHHPILAQLPRGGIIHRLDKDTTGLLMVAKSNEAYTLLTRMMQRREIHRHYIALVYGHIIAGGKIETGYGRHPRNRLKKAVLDNGRVAITDYRVIKSYENFTLLKLTLHTGRTHQIRVHMSHINHPIVGDPLYGYARPKVGKITSQELKKLLENFKRQALHAAELSFIHPILKTECTINADLPEDFSILLNCLKLPPDS